MIETLAIHPDHDEFVILSFEGPDRYALAGGLGVRVTNLAKTLAQQGFTVHLLFIGDPNLPGYESIEYPPVWTSAPGMDFSHSLASSSAPAHRWPKKHTGSLRGKLRALGGAANGNAVKSDGGAVRSDRPPGPLADSDPPIPLDGNGSSSRPASDPGRVHYYRWCQWISQYHPNGVYDGEETKLADFNQSIPPFIAEQIARPAVARGRSVIVLAEEWHTAQALINLSDQLHAAGLRDRCVLLWNANNTMGFDRIDWTRLSFVATLTTVSRYMKQIMRAHGAAYGVDPLIIPNGIPGELIRPVPRDAVECVRQALAANDTRVMIKVARFDPAKCWWMAVEAAAQLKHSGERVILLARGGIEPHGAEVLHHARQLGLVVRDVSGRPADWQQALELILQAGPADVYHLCFFMDQTMLRVFYAAADVVLANSKHEPFGLVGLEGMAAGGVVFTGPTGETYSADGQGAIALDTETADEIVLHLRALRRQPEQDRAIRHAAPTVAARFTWESVLEVLFEKIRLASCQQKTHLFQPHNRPAIHPVQDLVIYTVIHQPRRIHLPARTIPPGLNPAQMAEAIFDEAMDRRYFHKVAERCYYPATRKFIELVEQHGFKLTIGFSMSFIEQARRFDPALLDLYIHLVQHPNVELAMVEPYHSFIMLWDLPRFARRMQAGRAELAQIFGKYPQVADTTEMMMSDTIYHTLDQLGFKGAFFDGRPWVLGWRQASYLYSHDQGQMRLLGRHYQLSDDVGYRFSNRSWPGWPLMATTYAGWLADTPGDLITIGWDYETFGEHHNRETGIFEFIETLASEAPRRGLHFRTASEAIDRYTANARDLPLSAFHSTWAGNGGLDFFLGNPAQQSIFQLMLAAYNKALLTGDPDLIDLALWLAMSDNLHLIQWYGRQGSEAEVSAYFTPREWWQIGGERIILEMQQVYQNFIHALDEALVHPAEAGQNQREETRQLMERVSY